MTAPVVLASLLARNVPVIAGLELAGDCYQQIRNLVDDIEHCINRPTPPRYCGNCPTMDENQNVCSVPLYCKPDDAAVTCWRCHQVFNPDKLIQAAIARQHELLYTEREVLEIMAEIGKPIPERTWRYWRASGKLINRSEWAAEPAYWLEDVIALRSQSNQRRGLRPGH